jgi:hypothetical protein
MHVRPSSARAESSPGPSDYYSPRGLGGVSYSIKNRRGEKEVIDEKGLGEPRSFVDEGHKITIGSRITTRDVKDLPGPEYVPPGLGSDIQKIGISPRYVQSRDVHKDEPGPGTYNVGQTIGSEGQKFTLKSRVGTEKQNSNPGPDAYSPDYEKIGQSGASPLIHGRIKTRDIEVSPGPSDYEVKRELGGRSASIHTRPSEHTRDPLPGPSDYYSPSPIGGTSFTIKNRHEIVQHPIDAAYVSLNSFVGEGPKISLSSRHVERSVK